MCIGLLAIMCPHSKIMYSCLCTSSWNVSMMLLAIGSSTNSASWSRIINKFIFQLRKLWVDASLGSYMLQVERKL